MELIHQIFIFIFNLVFVFDFSFPLPITGDLNSIRGSNETSLSEKIHFRINSSVEYHSFPTRPNCESLLNINDIQYPISVAIWKIDLTNTANQGVLVWSELVNTRCTFGFWGSKSAHIVDNSVIPLITTLSNINFEKYLTNPIDEVIEDPSIPWESKYLCYYCQNDYPGHYERTLYKRVIISRYPDGSIWSPLGNWGHVTKNIYTDGKRYLYINYNQNTSQTCPFKTHEVRYGVLSISSSNTLIISLPSVKQQYSIPEGSDYMECALGDHKSLLWHTAGGYIISFPGDGIPMIPNILDHLLKSSVSSRSRRQSFYDIIRQRFSLLNSKRSRRSRHTDLIELSSNLRSDFGYTQFRYEVNFILKQINKNLILIQNNICDFLHLKWTSLYPPDLPRKVAQYITHSPHSIGEFRDGIYRITSTIGSNIPISLNIPLIREYGMFKVQDDHKNETLWVEPITGNLFKDPHWTHYSMIASWLPMRNGTGIDPLTGRIISSDTANTPITLIEQTEEYYPTALYSQGSLAGITEDNIFYNSQASPNHESPVIFTWWHNWMGHIIMALISVVLSLVLTPAVVKLLSACALKGEEVVEETLNLRRAKRSQLIP